MNWYEICSLCISLLMLLGFGTLTSQLLLDKKAAYKEKQRNSQEEADKQLEDKIRNIIKEEIEILLKEIESVRASNALEKRALQASLRDRLYELNKECVIKGYTTLEERENFENLYKNYHELDQNGVMDNTHAGFLSLKTEEEYFRKDLK